MEHLFLLVSEFSLIVYLLQVLYALVLWLFLFLLNNPKQLLGYLYKDLNEDKIREELCNDIFIYLEKILLKYEKSFTHFNVRNFISILYDRLQEVKDEKLPYIVYEEEEWLEGIIREMFDDKFNLIK